MTTKKVSPRGEDPRGPMGHAQSKRQSTSIVPHPEARALFPAIRAAYDRGALPPDVFNVAWEAWKARNDRGAQ
jgi:hypothetical protein